MIISPWRAAAAAAAALALPALLLSPAAQAAPIQPSTVTLPLHDAVASLPVADEDRAGYDRDAFRHWVDADRDGCHTRAEVLKIEAVQAPTETGRCSLDGGRWYSYYDDVYVDGTRGLDIDHMVPLAEAWDSGASEWSPEQREAYANDLRDDRALVAVTARSNRQKADRDPTDWLPPAKGAVCRYVTEWVAVKIRWELSVDDREQAALTEAAAGCPNAPVTVDLAD